MSKEISKQSFANTWGFAGPALMYWLGSSAFFYGLVFLTGLLFKNKSEYPEVLTVILFGVAHLIACLFVLKDFKSVARHLKDKAVKTPDFKLVVPAFVAEIVLAIGFGCSHRMSRLAQESTEEAYIPSMVICLLVFGIMVPAASNFVFAGICYHRAAKFMKGTIPMVFTMVLCSFMERSTGVGASLAFMMGISIYIFDKSGRYLYSLVSMVAASLVMTYVQYTSASVSYFEDGTFVLKLVVIAALIMIGVNFFDKKFNPDRIDTDR